MVPGAGICMQTPFVHQQPDINTMGGSSYQGTQMVPSEGIRMQTPLVCQQPDINPWITMGGSADQGAQMLTNEGNEGSSYLYEGTQTVTKEGIDMQIPVIYQQPGREINSWITMGASSHQGTQMVTGEGIGLQTPIMYQQPDIGSGVIMEQPGATSLGPHVNDVGGPWQSARDSALGTENLSHLLASSSYERHFQHHQMENEDPPENARDHCYSVDSRNASFTDSTLHGAAEPSHPKFGHKNAGMHDQINPMPWGGWHSSGSGVSNIDVQMGEYNARVDPLPNQEQNLQADDISGRLAIARGKQIAHFEGNTSNFGNLHDSHRTHDQVHVPINDNIKSLLSPNNNANVVISTSSTDLRRSTVPCEMSTPEGFTFKEVRSVRLSEEKFLSCHFSSDGKYLATAGQGKKVYIWETKNFRFLQGVEGHSDIITDIRFQPKSYIFATSSFDWTVKIWDLKKPRKTLQLEGHTDQVNSLDFHPRDTHILSSCDNSDQILLWDSNGGALVSTLKGGRRQVRFQPNEGRYLAAASGNNINIFDLDNGGASYCLEGHGEEVRSICWDVSGRYLASVSGDSARMWEVATNVSCIHALQTRGNMFETCAFHPGYYLALGIGSFQTIEWWNPLHNANETLPLGAHDGYVAALTACTSRDMMASAGSDGIVKVWK